MLNSLLSAYGRYRLRYPVYIFHHIPKCGGTSMRKALDDWFHVYDDYRDPGNSVSIEPVDLKYLNSQKCLCGHFGNEGYMIHQRYPKVFGSFRARHRYRVFSFLRDPLEMRCSLFRHEVDEQKNTSDSLVDSIMTYENYYARIMGLCEESYQAKLDRYFFIGIQEEMQASVDLLASLINKPTVTLPVANKSTRGKENRVDSLSAQEVAAFKQANQLDYKIYDYVLARLDRLKTYQG